MHVPTDSPSSRPLEEEPASEPAPWHAVLREAALGFRRHGDPLFAAALAFYATLSAAPLGIVAIQVAGWLFGETAARQELHERMVLALGPEVAEGADALLTRAAQETSTRWLLLAVAGTLLAASQLFVQVQRAINLALGLRPRRGLGWRLSVRERTRRRLLSIALALSSGLLLATMLVVRIVLDAIASSPLGHLPGLTMLTDALEPPLTYAVVGLLGAVVLKWLPMAEMRWRAALAGGLTTALLQAVITLPLGTLIGKMGVGSLYGAAGSLVVVLYWGYLASMAFFFGVEVARATAELRDGGLRPRPWAVRLVEVAHDEPEGVGSPVGPREAPRAPAGNGAAENDPGPRKVKQ